MDDELYKWLMYALIIGIVMSLCFNLFMRHKIMQKEGFSELYFNRHWELPDELIINESYDISVTIANHEIKDALYVFEADSGRKEEILLRKGEEKEIALSIETEEFGWKIILEQKETKVKDLGSVENLFADESLVLSPELSRFGGIYHVNLTENELRKKPFSAFRTTKSENENMTVLNISNATFLIRDKSLVLEEQMKQVSVFSERRPFIIRLYQKDASNDDILEIHWWYEIKNPTAAS